MPNKMPQERNDGNRQRFGQGKPDQAVWDTTIFEGCLKPKSVKR